MTICLSSVGRAVSLNVSLGNYIPLSNIHMTMGDALITWLGPGTASSSSVLAIRAAVCTSSQCDHTFGWIACMLTIVTDSQYQQCTAVYDDRLVG